LSFRVEQLQLTLERYRWWNYSFTQPRIVVNVPESRLTAYEGGGIALSMDVNVGDSYDYQTPLLENSIRSLVFRPYWHVPPGILRKEVVVDIARNRSYVRDNNMEVITRDGTVVTSGIVSDAVLSELRAGRLLVRQKPGPNNALGLIKFVFPNPYNVYMHDTPQIARVFAFDARIPSHGCIQLQRPAELAIWLLRNQPGWTNDRVLTAMSQGRDNFPITLTKPVPIMIVYRTAVAVEEGEVRFYPDIYGRDAFLKKALAKGYPYPKQSTPTI
jgi:L,D-transpeptidase YcbB